LGGDDFDLSGETFGFNFVPFQWMTDLFFK